MAYFAYRALEDLGALNIVNGAVNSLMAFQMYGETNRKRFFEDAKMTWGLAREYVKNVAEKYRS